MLFSSIPFLYYFLPCVLFLYFLVPERGKNAVLLVSSLVFYAWGEPACVFLMAGSILIGYVLGLLIEAYHSALCLWAGIAVFLGFLGYFKYADFVIENVNAVTGWKLSLFSAALPIGISFYTFQLLSYLIDVYLGSVKAQRNLTALAAYITMFPQLIAGPIVRYSDVDQELRKRRHSIGQISYGVRRFLCGLSKKVLIADLLAEFCSSFHLADEKSILFYWAYAAAVSLQIYFDFSGYSDMAIGLGSLFGFHFNENFDYPFFSVSITEFWRRWHKSLGSWFRDYVYLPLGGNRVGRRRQMVNILLVWCLTGLWHGAEWNFLLWGFYFGILLILEKWFFIKWIEKNRLFGHLYTIFFVLLSFVIFDASGSLAIADGFCAMFGAGGLPWITEVTVYYLKSYAVIFVIACIGATPFPARWAAGLRRNVRSCLEPFVLIFLLLTVTAYLVDGSFHPFLYFRF